MVSKVQSATTYGLEAKVIEVEVDFIKSQLPAFLRIISASTNSR